jgi:hypothetical protein
VRPGKVFRDDFFEFQLPDGITELPRELEGLDHAGIQDVPARIAVLVLIPLFLPVHKANMPMT